MNSVKYVGMDVHKGITVIVVLRGSRAFRAISHASSWPE
jgi:hypothetical protein